MKKWIKVMGIMYILSFLFGVLFGFVKHLAPGWRDSFSFWGGMIFMAIYLKLVNKTVYAQDN